MPAGSGPYPGFVLWPLGPAAQYTSNRFRIRADFFVARLPAPNPPLDKERTSTPLPTGDFIRRATEVIPDGNSIVCASNDSGEREIYLPSRSAATSTTTHRLPNGPAAGHQWLKELWEETVPEELDDELGSILMALSFFSSREIAAAFHGESTTGEQSFEAMADAIHRVLPTAVAQYARMGRSIATVLASPASRWRPPSRVIAT